jgi:hypothetical protein
MLTDIYISSPLPSSTSLLSSPPPIHSSLPLSPFLSFSLPPLLPIPHHHLYHYHHHSHTTPLSPSHHREDTRNGISRKGYGAIAKKGARKGVSIDGMDGWVDMENQDTDDKKKKKGDDDDDEEEEEEDE